MVIRLQLRLLGVPDPTVDGQPLAELKLKKTQALLYYLAANPGPQKRATLSALLWGDLPDASAGANLRKSLFQLNQHLAPFLQIERDSAMLRHGALVGVDVLDFEAKAVNPAQRALAQLEEAVALFRGSFLEAFYVHGAPDFEQWVLNERQRFNELALGAHDALAAGYAERGDLSKAIAHMRGTLAIEPWREEAHRQLMVWLAQDGQRSAAMAQYETCRRALRDELDVAPSPETEALYADIRTAKPHRPDHAASLTYGKPQRALWRERLPRPAGRCIGRGREIARLIALLESPQVRLVTITGPGGMGKTRLALAVIEQWLDRGSIPPAFRDGIYFVPLAPVSAAAQATPTVAAILGFQSKAGDPSDAGRQLLDYLRNKQLLLVLDNFEHLAEEGAPWLSEIGRHAPGVKLLITSREPLSLSDEQRFPVAGLPLTHEAVTEAIRTGATDGRNVADDGALGLFLDRAQRLQPDFRITEDNLRDVERICRMTGGMPLAIQLAAGWITLLTPAEIATEIAANFSFLSASEHDVPERHRNLSAVIEPSWARLSAADQDTFARLCVCRGGFSRADAQALTGCELAGLARLQQSSFLQYAVDTGRFQIHEVLRQFGMAQLEREVPRKDDALERHARHYCAWLARQSGQINGREQMTVLGAMDIEVENCRAAWEWAASRGDAQLLTPAADPFFFYFEYRGRFEEGVAACQAALDNCAGRDGSSTGGDCDRLQVHLLAWQATFSRTVGRFADAKRQMQLALDQLEQLAARGIDLPAEAAFVRLRWGEMITRGSPRAAHDQLQASHALYLSIGDVWGAARALEGAGVTRMFRLESYAAAAYYQQAMALLGADGDPRRQVWLRLRLGLVLAFAGQQEEAERYARESVALARAFDDRGLVARALAEQAAVGYFLGNPRGALERAQESLAFYREFGDRMLLANINLIVGNIRLQRGEWEHCRTHAGEALALLSDTQDRGYYVWAHGLLAATWLAEHNCSRAQKEALEALQAAELTEFRYHVSTSHCLVALPALLTGDTETARRHLGASVACVETSVMEQEAVQALLFACCFLAHRGSVDSATEVYATIRHCTHIASSVFCRQIASEYLEPAIAVLRPAQYSVPKARPSLADLRALARTVRTLLEQV